MFSGDLLSRSML